MIPIDKATARIALVVCFLACIASAYFFAKWCFADTVSPRAAFKEVADLAVRWGPDDPQTHFAAAVIYEKTFEPEDIAHSLYEYERVAALSPNNYLSWRELGKARDRSGDTDGAERAYLRALDLAPNYADVQWSYGNSLIRAGRTDEGFGQIRMAAAARPEYMNSAIVLSVALLDSDPAQIRDVLGNTDAVNAALSTYELNVKHYREAVSAWESIADDEKRSKYGEVGRTLLSQLAGAKQFRLAASVARTVWDTNGTGPTEGSIFNGGFELPIKLKDAGIFDWQIGGVGETQIGLSDSQKHGGIYSLYMVFNTMRAADIRQVSQSVAVVPGKPYSFEGFYRAELKGSLAWEIVDANEGKSLARTAPVQSSADWINIRTTFTVPDSSDGIIIRLVRDGCVSSVCPISGRIWFDDLSISQRDSMTTGK